MFYLFRIRKLLKPTSTSQCQWAKFGPKGGRHTKTACNAVSPFMYLLTPAVPLPCLLCPRPAHVAMAAHERPHPDDVAARLLQLLRAEAGPRPHGQPKALPPAPDAHRLQLGAGAAVLLPLLPGEGRVRSRRPAGLRQLRHFAATFKQVGEVQEKDCQGRA